MHIAQLNKRMSRARESIAAHAQRLADATGQTFTPPDSHQDLKQNMVAPLDSQVLALAELTAAALSFIADVLAPEAAPAEK